MGVDVRIDGMAEWNASRVSVTEDSTPVDPSDTFGGAALVEFTLPAGDAAKSITGKPVEVLYQGRGGLSAVAKAPQGGRGSVTVEAWGLVSAFVCKRTADPHVGTVGSLLAYWAGLCGVADLLDVDESIAAVDIVAPGWYDNVWEQVKALGAAYDFEVAPVGDRIVVRPMRGFTASIQREAAFRWSLDESHIAQTVEAWYYTVAPITDALVVGNEVNPRGNIEAGEVQEFTVQLKASVSSVVQPVPVAAVGFGDRDASVYSIRDKDGNPVPPDAWTAAGGRVTVEIGRDTRSLTVRVVGSQNRMLAPYQMTAVAISGAEYSTLRVVGTGVSLDRKKYVLSTAPHAEDAEEVGAEVDNYYFTSWGHAHLRLLATARRCARVAQRISGSAAGMIPAPLVDGQVFGNVAGARVFEDHDVYRVRVARHNPLTVDYEAEGDLTFPDVDAVVSGHTVDEWDALWAGRPVADFDLRPLTPIPGDVEPPTGGYGSGVYGGPPVYGG